MSVPDHPAIAHLSRDSLSGPDGEESPTEQPGAVVPAAPVTDAPVAGRHPSGVPRHAARRGVLGQSGR
ncbi:hypothetical protein [Saccharothrix yanglingensis]|uniref:Uncharacterized protein n=1 Tax=Saccharothrix yanglingensis TaxID=659496 RepID=A0ABU0WZA4_9PSEU|nr:hypothetical protein [Saccharothrix yanglingensis]MDQ2585195.1 hypothetical protein [Saccharothrix yanglingensis]